MTEVGLKCFIQHFLSSIHLNCFHTKPFILILPFLQFPCITTAITDLGFAATTVVPYEIPKTSETSTTETWGCKTRSSVSRHQWLLDFIGSMRIHDDGVVALLGVDDKGVTARENLLGGFQWHKGHHQ